MLRIDGLSFSYGPHQVLDQVDLRVAPGEVVALLGPNGTGKSTLLKCILGILRPAAGEITVNDRNVACLRRRDLARALAYVPQYVPAGFPIKVFDAVLMGRRSYLHWSPGEKDLRIVDAVMADLGLSELALRDLNTLSGGQLQKAYLARALAQEADFLLLDEPTSNLDLRHQLEGMTILRRAADSGKGVLIALHDIPLAARHVDRLVALHQGGVIAQGAPHEILDATLLAKLYGVHAEVIRQPGDCRVMILGPLCENSLMPIQLSATRGDLE